MQGIAELAVGGRVDVGVGAETAVGVGVTYGVAEDVGNAIRLAGGVTDQALSFAEADSHAEHVRTTSKRTARPPSPRTTSTTDELGVHYSPARNGFTQGQPNPSQLAESSPACHTERQDGALT